ncbi:MAG: metal-dependent hydrolase [Helicobacter sp.]|uniref:metal-dependent hydrolase n=1 Tax=Helicobacter TaxID=209 RepID=UPI00202A735B|nr:MULTISPECIES: metal-dependent hydrolase [Helicobacter]MCL9823521.1 metal-dependent hydrolase [Helicobacter colisuis]MDY4426819.1 metal-dependent hydrolase [Helicobacter sp.]
MLGKTHLAFGLGVASCGIYAINFLGKPQLLSSQDLILFYSAISIGALLPDIDEPQSLIGRKTLGISNLIKFFFGHRGFTHSLLFVVLLAIALGALIYFKILSLILAIGLVLGCILHLIGDMMTPSGVPLLMPFSLKNYHILPRVLRFKTGGIFDYLIGLISAGAFIYCNTKPLQKYFLI